MLLQTLLSSPSFLSTLTREISEAFGDGVSGSFVFFSQFPVLVYTSNLVTITDARSQLILCGNFLVYLFLMAADRAHIESAHKMLEDFRVKVNKISLTDHTPTRAMIRATTIRTNSFFAQAAAVMRHGPEASITEPITVCGTDGPVSA